MNNNLINFFFDIILLKCPKKFQIKETQKNLNQRDIKKTEYFYRRHKKIPLKHVVFFALLRSFNVFFRFCLPQPLLLFPRPFLYFCLSFSFLFKAFLTFLSFPSGWTKLNTWRPSISFWDYLYLHVTIKYKVEHVEMRLNMWR
jgi:hypothetical protein